MAVEKAFAYIGEMRGCDDHDYDLDHGWSQRLDGLWRYDQYIVNANGLAELSKFWRKRTKAIMDVVGRSDKGSPAMPWRPSATRCHGPKGFAPLTRDTAVTGHSNRVSFAEFLRGLLTGSKQ